MATIITRAGKGSPLENNEVDANFTNLNDDKLEAGDNLGTPSGVVLTNATGLPTSGLLDNAVTDAKLRDSAALSVIGRASTGTGNPADIEAGANGSVLRRSGSSIGFGAIDLGSNQAVSGTLPVNQGGTGSTTAAGALTNFGLTATATELNYTDGVTSSIQTQLNTKAPTASPTFTGTVTADGLSLGDNDKATFGAGNDLEIYHDGSNSYIRELGTGTLIIQASDNIKLQSHTGEFYFQGIKDGASKIYFDNAEKLITTSTGIDVTGNYVNSGHLLHNNNSGLKIIGGGDATNAGSNLTLYGGSNASAGTFRFRNGTATHLEVAGNGDISFYEDTGTTPKFFWDASAESLGIGSVSPGCKVDIVAADNTSLSPTLRINSNNVAVNAALAYDGLVGSGEFELRTSSAAALKFGTNNTERMRIDSSGNVGIGTVPNAWLSTFSALQLGQGSSLWGAATGNNAGFDSNVYVNTSGGSVYIGSASATRYQQSSGNHRWFIAPSGTAGNTISFTQAMTLDSSGNLLVGKTSSSFSIAGHSLLSTGYAAHTRSGGNPLTLNRLTSDGSILAFEKDGTTVGSIGVFTGGTTTYIDGGATHTGLVFGSSALGPRDAGTTTDGTVDLGSTGGRFKDLYLSGTAYINGITVGRGAGAVATNTAVGAYALAANTSGNRNTAVGYDALLSNTTGTNNTAIGLQALEANTTGNYNVAVGRDALVSNTTADDNTALGYQSLYSNTTGTFNTATGRASLVTNTTGADNVATGYRALYLNTTASNNTATGYETLYSNTTGGNNVASGHRSLYSNTSGSNNVSSGLDSLRFNSTGSFNVAIGRDALYGNTTASYNTAAGYRSLYTNTTGADNNAFGPFALESNTTGGDNNAFGRSALKANTTGVSNTAMGHGAVDANTTGNYNSGFGANVLSDNTTGSNNVATGYRALFNNTTASNNVANGFEALYSNTTGANNTATGHKALYANTTGINNTALGYVSLQSNTTGNNNIGLGVLALSANTTGLNNVAIGRDSLLYSTTGNGNTAVGVNSGYLISTGAKNTIIGAYSGNQDGLDIRTLSNRIVLSDGDGNPRAHDNGQAFHIHATSAMNVSTNGHYLRAYDGGYAYHDIGHPNATASGAYYNLFRYNTSIIGTITQNGTSGVSYNTTSDYRLKENVVALSGATDRLKQLKPSRFNFIADSDITVDGFLAHEVQDVVPEAITGTKDAVDDEGNPIYQGIDQSKLVPLLVATIKELEARISTLEGN